MNRNEAERDAFYVSVFNKLTSASKTFSATTGYMLSDLDDHVQSAMEKVLQWTRNEQERSGATFAFNAAFCKRARGYGAACVKNSIIDELRREPWRRSTNKGSREDDDSSDEGPPGPMAHGGTPEEHARATSLIRALGGLRSVHAKRLMAACESILSMDGNGEVTRADLARLSGLNHTQLGRLADEIVRRGIDDGFGTRGLKDEYR